MTQEELQVLLTWFSVVVGVIGIISFIFNIYQHFKIQSLRQAVDSIDRIAKSAKMECAKIENSPSGADEKSSVRVVSGLVTSILNVTTTFMSYNRKHFESGAKSAPFISVD